MHDTARRHDRLVREALATHSGLGEAARDLDPDADLYCLGLTSLDSVRVLLAIEDALGTEISEHLVGRALFASVRHLSETLDGLTDGAHGTEGRR